MVGLFMYIKLIFVLFFGLYFLENAQREQTFKKRQQIQLLSKAEIRLASLQHRRELYLIHAYLTGNTKKISHDLMDKHKGLFLLHLFTPSGLHLSSFFLFWKLLIFFFRRRKRLYQLLLVLPCLGPFFLPGTYSLHRMALFKLGCLKTKKKDPSVLFRIYLLTFIIDYYWGDYKLSPLSFAYSFLFFGSLISVVGQKKRYFVFALLCSQMLASMNFYGPFNLLSFLSGIFLSSIFVLLFPSMLMAFLLIKMKLFFFYFPMAIFIFLIEQFHSLANKLPTFSPTPLIIVLTFGLLFCHFSKKKRWIILLATLASSPLLNFPKEHFGRLKYAKNQRTALHPSEIITAKYTLKGVKMRLGNGKRCYAYLLPYGLKDNCRIQYRAKSRKAITTSETCGKISSSSCGQ